MSLVARSTIEFTIFACKFDRQIIGVRQRSRFPANHRFVSSSTTLSIPLFPALSLSLSTTVDQIRVSEPQISPFSPFSLQNFSLSDRWFLLFLFKPIFLFFILLKLNFFPLFIQITVLSSILGGVFTFTALFSLVQFTFM